MVAAFKERPEGEPLTREGLHAYFDQMSDADGRISTTADWLADTGMLIIGEATKTSKLPGAGVKEATICQWCGRFYADHEDARPEGSPVPRTPCLLLKSGFLARKADEVKAPELITVFSGEGTEQFVCRDIDPGFIAEKIKAGYRVSLVLMTREEYGQYVATNASAAFFKPGMK